MKWIQRVEAQYIQVDQQDQASHHFHEHPEELQEQIIRCGEHNEGTLKCSYVCSAI